MPNEAAALLTIKAKFVSVDNQAGNLEEDVPPLSRYRDGRHQLRTSAEATMFLAQGTLRYV